MKNFGKLTPSEEIAEIPGLQVGTTEDGEPIFEAGQKVRVIIYRTAAGVDIVDAAKVDPHPFYIVVKDDGLIVSMTDDIEQSQIEGFDVIGIDHDYGFTFGPGGNVYGKKWTGLGIESAAPNADDVIAERDRRLQLGFEYDFADERGKHHIGTSEAAMRRWMDEVTPLAQAFINANQPGGQIYIATNTGQVTVTASEWQLILIASASFRQPLYQASFALQAMNPIPGDYKDDKYWLNNP